MLPARLTRWKGQELLVEAVSRLSGARFVCLLVGSPQRGDRLQRDLEKMILAKHLGGAVQVVGHCPDMPAAYMLADVVVSASTDPEAFGRVVAEAQAMGRIIVAPAHGAAPEQITQGKTGFLFTPGDAQALADALAKALSLNNLTRQHVSAAAMAHARATYPRERMCHDTLVVYDELITATSQIG